MSGRVAPLLWTLKRGAPDEQARAGHAIYQLQSMGGDPYKNDAEIVSALVDQGAIPLAVELMGKASGPVQEVAALILRPIAQKVDALRQKVLGAGVVSPLLKMLQQGPEKGPAHYAAGLIVNLAYDAGGAKEIREQGALPLLFTLAQDPRTPSFGRYQAIDAMGTLAKFDEESARVVSTAPGILQLLVTSLADAGTAAVAASALGHLSCGRQWAVEMVQRAGAIPALIQAFNTPDDDQLDKAVHALLQIASTGEAVWPEIVQAGGLDAIFGVLEKRDVPGRCVQSCGACIVYWLWKKEDLRGPIHTALASFVHALGPRLASTVEAERVTALKGLLHLVDGKKFKEPTISAALVHSGVIPLAVSAAADLRPAVQALAIQILHGLSASGDQPAAREALIKFDFAAPVMRMLHSTDPLVKADAAELLTQLVMFEERTDAWWADPPTLLRPADFVTHRLVAAGIIPICLQWIRDPAETEAVRVAGALTLTRVCCYRMWGQVALQHALGIPAAIEILVRPDTPADLRRACAFLLANAVKKNEHATWTFVQAGGMAALFQALELTDKGEYLERTVDGLMTTLRHAWEIVPPRTHIFPVLKAFVDRIVGSAGGSWEKRDRLLLGLYTAVDPELAAVDATLQDAFIQAGAFTLLVPMVADPITAAQVWAAKILRCLVTANHATKRTLNNYGGLEKLFEALKVGNAEVREEVLRCLGEALAEAGELSVIAIKKWEAVKLLSQCVVHGEPAVQERAMWVIGRMTLHQAVVARLMGQNKPKQLISILIQKAKDTAATPTTQYYAVYALEFLTAAPQDNVKLALKGGMVPVFIDIIKSSAAEDRTRIRALSTLTDNSRAYYRFSGKCSRCGIYKLTWKLKDDPEASPAVQEAAGKAYKEMWKALGEGFFYSCGLTFDMRTNMLNASRGRI